MWSRVWVLVWFVSAAAACAADIRVRCVQSSGEPAVGFPAGAVFHVQTVNSRRPILNERGHVVFTALTTGGGVTADDDQGLWLATADGVVLLSRENDSLTNDPAAHIGSFELAGLTDDDFAWFAATLREPSGMGRALCRVRAGEPVEVLARNGDPVPGFPGETWSNFAFEFNGFADAAANRVGQVVFQGVTSARPGLFVADGTTIVPLFMTGWPAPGFPPETTVTAVAFGGWSDSGQLLMQARLVGPEITTSNDDVLYAYTTAGGQLVAREGEPVPGAPDARYDTLFFAGEPTVSGERVGFTAHLVGPPDVNAENDTAVFHGLPAAPRMLLREGDAVPGLPGVALGEATSVTTWAQGTAFWNLPGDGVASVCKADADGVSFVARIGDIAPDVGAGVRFADVPAFGNDGPIRANNAGRVAFPARLAPPLGSGNQAAYAQDAVENLRCILATAARLESPGGALREVSAIDNMSFSDAGDLALHVRFAAGDATGIVIAAVGCPGSGCDGPDVAGSDCVVDLADLAVLLSNFGSTALGVAGDVDRDGDVDLMDLARLLAAFGANCN